MDSENSQELNIQKVREYWGKKNIPQQWYSKKEPFTLSWFNELSFKRYNTYYEYLTYIKHICNLPTRRHTIKDISK